MKWSKVPHFVRRYKGRWRYRMIQWLERRGYCCVVARSRGSSLSSNVKRWIEIGPGNGPKRMLRGKLRASYHAVYFECPKGKSQQDATVKDWGFKLRYTMYWVIIWRSK